MPKTQLSQRQNHTSPKRALGAIVALVVVFLLLTSVIGLAEKYHAIRGRVKDLKVEETTLAAKQEELRETNRYIESPEGRERELRAKYNVIKPGEGMVVITEPSEPATDARPSTRVGRWWESLMKGLGIQK